MPSSLDKGVSAPARLQSLDMLRGVTVALMIVVNTSGDGAHSFRQLTHSAWNGCTVTDVVFPCFLFMVGLAARLSAVARMSRGATRKEILLQALRRSAVLFALGLVVNSFPLFDLHTLRVFGVLQRIAICYFVVTALVIGVRPRALAWIGAAILLGYWVALRWVPVPGLGRPGIDVPFLDRFANLAAWVDRALLPANHLYRQSTYDPEGLLSTLPAVATTLAGTLTGAWIKSGRSGAAVARGLLLGGTVLAVAGLGWSMWFPLNKRLWTSSFVLFTAGVSVLALWCFYRFVDLRSGDAPRWLLPATVFGTNALGAYLLSELLASLLGAIHVGPGLSLQRWLYRPLAEVIGNPPVSALVYAVLFMAVCYVPAWLLYRRRIFLKL